MQSVILLAVMLLTSIFITMEMKRNNYDQSEVVNKSKNIAANIEQYQDLVVQYILKNYTVLHLDFSTNPGNVEKIELLQYKENSIDSYSQKDFYPFLNYRTVIFNYAKALPNETEITPVLYVATSFDSYFDLNIYKTYSKIKFFEVMGQLGEDLSKHLYQGNSTYWTVPWLFSQKACNIIEVYSQISDDADEHGDGKSNYRQFQTLFNNFCNQIEESRKYVFLTYVYMQPVFNPANI